jgi:hypothetical protein
MIVNGNSKKGIATIILIAQILKIQILAKKKINVTGKSKISVLTLKEMKIKVVKVIRTIVKSK